MTDVSWKLDVSSACIGSGMCAAIAPDSFDLSSGRARAVADTVEHDQVYLDAAESCPASAITVSDPDTNAVLAPGE